MATIEITKNKTTLEIKLNRPDKRNAFNQEMIAELTEAFANLSKEKEARVLILKGEGKSFSAGADLSWMQSMVNYSTDENREDSKKLYEMYRALEQIPFPVVGHLQGHVMGGALGLAALCDVAAAETDTQFCFSEIKLGLAPAVVSEFAAKKISRSQLSRWFLTAEVFDAGQAQKMGLVHFVGSKGDVQKFVDNTVNSICHNGPEATRATKELITRLYGRDDDFKSFSVDMIARLRTGAEGQEGLTAFFEKRKPKWND